MQNVWFGEKSHSKWIWIDTIKWTNMKHKHCPLFSTILVQKSIKNRFQLMKLKCVQLASVYMVLYIIYYLYSLVIIIIIIIFVPNLACIFTKYLFKAISLISFSSIFFILSFSIHIEFYTASAVHAQMRKVSRYQIHLSSSMVLLDLIFFSSRAKLQYV